MRWRNCGPPTSAPSSRRGAAKGLGAGGVQRALAAIRSFYKFLAREGILENAAPRAVRTPRIKRGLPRPLSEDRCRSAPSMKRASTMSNGWARAMRRC